MSLESLVYSKHYIFKPNVFTTTKKLLTLKFSCMTIDHIPTNASTFEIIDYSDILKIEPNEKREKDLLIHYKSKNNSQNLILELCSHNRALLLIELYKAQDLYESFKRNYKETPLEFTCSLIFAETHQEELTLEMTRTCLKGQYLHKPQKDPSLLKEFLDISPKNSDLVLKKPQDFADFLLTFNQIKSVIPQENELYIVLHGSDLLINLRWNEENSSKFPVASFLNELMKRFEQFFKGFPAFEILNKGVELALSYKTLQSLITRVKAVKVSPSKRFKELIVLALNENFLFEITADNNNLLNKIPLAAISNIIRTDYPENTGLQLVFNGKGVEEYHLDGFSRDLLISNLLYLLSTKKIDQFRVELIQSQGGSFLKNEQKVEGFLNNEPDYDYEMDLIKRLLTPKREENFNEVLKELTANISLKKYDFNDNRVLICLMEKFLSFNNIYSQKAFRDMALICSAWSNHQNIELNEKYKNNNDLIKEHEDLTNKLEVLKSSLPLKINALTIDFTTYSQILYYMEEILKALTLLVSNRGLFKEFSMNKKEPLYEKFLIQVVGLMSAPNQVISYLAINFLKTLSHLPYILDNKTECISKFYLLSQVSLDLLPNLSKLFREKLVTINENTNPDCLSMISAVRLLKSWVKDKKESTSLEDLDKINRLLNKKETLCYLSCLFIHTDNFMLISHISCLLYLALESKASSSMFSLQKYLFESTISMLSCLRAIFSCKQSAIHLYLVSFLAKVLEENGDACSLLIRIIPKPCFSLCKATPPNLTKWELKSWEILFELLNKDHSAGNIFWDSLCREELCLKLSDVEKGFVKRLKIVLKKHLNENLEVAAGSSYEKIFEKVSLNHRELYVDYENLNRLCCVGKYYLILLLSESNDVQQTPKLSMSITQIYRFWTELIFAFISKEDISEKFLILKVMILIVREYSIEIKDFSCMGYFLNLLAEKKDLAFLYLLLQLIYTSLTREDSRMNKRMFLQCDGVDKLFLLLTKLIPLEKPKKTSLQNIEDQPKENSEKSSENLQKNREEEDLFSGIRNYSGANFAAHLVIGDYELKVNSCLFILEIIRTLLSESSLSATNKDGKELYPAKSLKSQLKNEIYIEIICNFMLSTEEKLYLVVLELLKEELLCRELFPYFLAFKGFFDVLMSNFQPKTQELILDIVFIYEKLLLENPKQLNYIKMYTLFSFEELAEPTQKKAIDFFPFMKYFPGSLLKRLLESGRQTFLDVFYSKNYEFPDLIWNEEMLLFLQETLKNKLEIHEKALKAFSQTEELGNIPQWETERLDSAFKKSHNNYMEEIVTPANTSLNYLTNQSRELMSPIEKASFSIKFKPIPRYKSELLAPIHYQNLCEEVTCGPLFLRVWNRRECKDFVLEKINVDKFIKALEHKMAILMREIQENEGQAFEKHQHVLLQLLISLSKAIKLYQIHNYQNFEETLTIIKHFSQFANGEKFVLICLRGIFRAISIENSGNLENYLRKKGFLAIFEVFRIEIHRIFEKFGEGFIDLDTTKIKIIVNILKILVVFSQKSIEEINSLEAEKLLSFLQFFSKISVLISYFLAQTLSNKEQEQEIKGIETIFEDKQKTKNFLALMSNFAILIKNFTLQSALVPHFLEIGLAFSLIYASLYYEDLITVKTDENIEEICSFFKEFVEKITLSLRNLSIWGYETYLLISNGGPKKLDIPSDNSKKSSKLFLNIHKLPKNHKEAISLFYEILFHLLFKENLLNLLKDYQEPSDEIPESLSIFLQILSKDNEELCFLWTKEMRMDLKLLIETEIFKKIACSDEIFNKSELLSFKDYNYPLHLNELEIEGVFLSVFNKNPKEKKLPSFGYFIKLLFFSINENWDNLQRNTELKPVKTNKNRLNDATAVYFYKIKQAIYALSNILNFQGLDSAFLDKAHFQILVKSLENSQKQPKEICQSMTENEFFSDFFVLQREILSMLARLTQQKEGIISLLQNKTAILAIIRALRSNQQNTAKESVFKIIENIALQRYLFEFLPKFGFISYLFEFVLKNEIFSLDSRKKAFEFLLLFFNEKEDSANKQVLNSFLKPFPSILSRFLNNPLSFLENINKEIESFDEIWTPKMRKEYWRAVKEFNDLLQLEVEKIEDEYISLDSNVITIEKQQNLNLILVCPEIKEEIAVNQIYLRSFIKNPANLDISKEFVEELIAKSEDLVNKLEKFYENKQKNEEYNRVIHEFLLISCSFLLILEQIWAKDLLIILKEIKIEILEKWINLITHNDIHPHLKCVLLQILLIALELEIHLKPIHSLVELLCHLLQKNADYLKNKDKETKFSTELEAYNSNAFYFSSLIL